MGLIIKSIDN